MDRTTIFIGIDGGATKTIARVEDSRGNLLGTGKGGSANIRLSPETAWQSILFALQEVLEPANIDLNDNSFHFVIGCGLAGTQVPSACQQFLNTPHPFAQLVLESDGYISCLGAHGGQEGAVIAIGTGVTAYQIEGGKSSHVSGWGFPHGDEGSGAWLGLEAVRLTLHWQDGRQEPSPLLEAVFNHFDRDLTKLVVWANQGNATQFAQIAPIVIQQVREKTPLAIDLIQKAAREIDKIGVALAAKATKPLPCSLLGGLSPSIEPWLSQETRSRLVPPQYDAAKGAILMIRQALEKS